MARRARVRQSEAHHLASQRYDMGDVGQAGDALSSRMKRRVGRRALARAFGARERRLVTCADLGLVERTVARARDRAGGREALEDAGSHAIAEEQEMPRTDARGRVTAGQE